MLVLDTDHLSLLERPESAERHRLVRRLEQVAEEPIVTTTVSYEEQSRGWLAYVARARVWPKKLAVAEKSVAVYLGNVVQARISAAAFGAFGAELPSAAGGSRDSAVHRITTSTVVMDFDRAEF